MSLRLLGAALGLAGLAGCGAGGSRAPDGAALFRSQCAGCHTIVGNENRRTQGGDLLDYRMTRAQVIDFASQMPTPTRLSAAQIAAVSDYVRAAQARRARSGNP